jgi:hypothetical protein
MWRFESCTPAKIDFVQTTWPVAAKDTTSQQIFQQY